MHKFDILQRSPLFHMLAPAELTLTAELSREVRLEPGELVFEEGEPGDSLFIIGEGEVEILRHDESGAPKLIGVVGAPGFFGEMALIDKELRSATVRARTACLLLQLSAGNFATLRKHHRDAFTFVIMNIARVLSSRLREANARLAGRL
ncbi:MAG: cyclic nucleotide-binding domain-containing protein [Myxococcales bacterium]